jgi:hypothetical protein
MSIKTKEVRRFALFISAITAISMVLTGCSAPSDQVLNQQPKTSQFVMDSFQDGQFLDPFEEGKPDMGSTLEAIANLSLLGYSTSDLQKQIDWVKANTTLLSSAGLKANYVYTAYVAGFANDASVVAQLQIMKDYIAEDGTVKDTNNFAYSYVLLALIAAEQDELANKVSLKLISNAEVNGGYKYTKGDTESFESADVTAFALMSIQASLGLSSAEDDTAKQFSIDKSKEWLLNNLVTGDHFEAYENLDLGGTSYATMALIASGQDATKLVAWLAARIKKEDGGIPSPFSANASDVFTTVQALLPLSSVTLVDAINKINSERVDAN